MSLEIFLYAIAFALGYDLLWFFFSASVWRKYFINSFMQAYSSGNIIDGGKENSVRFFVFLTSMSSLILKILLGLSIWIQKLKHERGIEDKDNKNV